MHTLLIINYLIQHQKCANNFGFSERHLHRLKVLFRHSYFSEHNIQIALV